MALYHKEDESPSVTLPTIRLEGAANEFFAAEGASYWTGRLGVCLHTALLFHTRQCCVSVEVRERAQKIG